MNFAFVSLSYVSLAFSAVDCVVPARGKYLVPTDLSIACPMGTYGRIAPRSGLANKYFIDVGAGVIDSDYRGPVCVILFNHSNEDFKIKKRDRIAQLILEKIEMNVKLCQVESLDETIRGHGGFGSTGITANINSVIETVKETFQQWNAVEYVSDFSIKTFVDWHYF